MKDTNLTLKHGDISTIVSYANFSTINTKKLKDKMLGINLDRVTVNLNSIDTLYSFKMKCNLMKGLITIFFIQIQNLDVEITKLIKIFELNGDKRKYKRRKKQPLVFKWNNKICKSFERTFDPSFGSLKVSVDNIVIVDNFTDLNCHFTSSFENFECEELKIYFFNEKLRFFVDLEDFLDSFVCKIKKDFPKQTLSCFKISKNVNEATRGSNYSHVNQKNAIKTDDMQKNIVNNNLNANLCYFDRRINYFCSSKNTQQRKNKGNFLKNEKTKIHIERKNHKNSPSEFSEDFFKSVPISNDKKSFEDISETSRDIVQKEIENSRSTKYNSLQYVNSKIDENEDSRTKNNYKENSIYSCNFDFKDSRTKNDQKVLSLRRIKKGIIIPLKKCNLNDCRLSNDFFNSPVYKNNDGDVDNFNNLLHQELSGMKLDITSSYLNYFHEFLQQLTIFFNKGKNHESSAKILVQFLKIMCHFCFSNSNDISRDDFSFFIIKKYHLDRYKIEFEPIYTCNSFNILKINCRECSVTNCEKCQSQFDYCLLKGSQSLNLLRRYLLNYIDSVMNNKFPSLSNNQSQITKNSGSYQADTVNISELNNDIFVNDFFDTSNYLCENLSNNKKDLNEQYSEKNNVYQKSFKEVQKALKFFIDLRSNKSAYFKELSSFLATPKSQKDSKTVNRIDPSSLDFLKQIYQKYSNFERVPISLLKKKLKEIKKLPKNINVPFKKSKNFVKKESKIDKKISLSNKALFNDFSINFKADFINIFEKHLKLSSSKNIFKFQFKSNLFRTYLSSCLDIFTCCLTQMLKNTSKHFKRSRKPFQETIYEHNLTINKSVVTFNDILNYLNIKSKQVILMKNTTTKYLINIYKILCCLCVLKKFSKFPKKIKIQHELLISSFYVLLRVIKITSYELIQKEKEWENSETQKTSLNLFSSGEYLKGSIYMDSNFKPFNLQDLEDCSIISKVKKGLFSSDDFFKKLTLKNLNFEQQTSEDLNVIQKIEENSIYNTVNVNKTKKSQDFTKSLIEDHLEENNKSFENKILCNMICMLNNKTYCDINRFVKSIKIRNAFWSNNFLFKQVYSVSDSKNNLNSSLYGQNHESEKIFIIRYLKKELLFAKNLFKLMKKQIYSDKNMNNDKNMVYSFIENILKSVDYGFIIKSKKQLVKNHNCKEMMYFETFESKTKNESINSQNYFLDLRNENLFSNPTNVKINKNYHQMPSKNSHIDLYFDNIYKIMKDSSKNQKNGNLENILVNKKPFLLSKIEEMIVKKENAGQNLDDFLINDFTTDDFTLQNESKMFSSQNSHNFYEIFDSKRIELLILKNNNFFKISSTLSKINQVNAFLVLLDLSHLKKVKPTQMNPFSIIRWENNI